MLIDAQARKDALDVRQSFIVQAPAGSGKTELLTQRFLALLACVERHPEEVLAITFTKKAALEMRQRIVAALHKACDQPEPTSEHEQTTWQLARQVLQRDAQCQWHILQNPNRLNIQTIDALCASISKRLPLLSGLGVGNDVVENARSLYQQAALNTLQQVNHDHVWSSAIYQLLDYFDNQQYLVTNLLQQMLASRDQWLAYCLHDDLPQLKEKLEHGLAQLIKKQVTHFVELLSPYAERLQTLLAFASDNLAQAGVASPILYWQEVETWPGLSNEELKLWQALPEWLLSSQHKFRKSMAKGQGFPAPSAIKDKIQKAIFKQQKDDVAALLAEFAENESLLTAFNRVRQLPQCHFGEQEWQLLTALLKVLPVAYAQLKVLFSQQQAVDFIEIAQAALHALGTDDEPTDLALAMDYKISHILVDEFQDTSKTQWQLLEKLIMGWLPDDGRTLFLVGDPMQSIYRFRQAEVGLFLRAQQQGIGTVQLQSLQLAANFRSDKNLVNWFNQQCQLFFPDEDDIMTSAVKYHPSSAIKELSSAGINIHPILDSSLQQAETVLQCVQQALSNDADSSIAILVRSRAQLAEICPLLQEHGIAFNGVDIAPLRHNKAVQDCIALTRAICHQGDEIAWAAILRAPWLGLTLTELHQLSHARADATLWQRLHDESLCAELSVQSQQNIARVRPILADALQNVGRIALRDCIYGTWLALAAHEWLSETDRPDVARYFELLQQLSHRDPRIHSHQLEEMLSTSYSVAKDNAARVQIMTIHKAKGLEFDTVILPGLGSRPPYEAHRLLNWIEIAQESGEYHWLLAPYAESHVDSDGIYDFIHQMHKEKAKQELIRLLYVAMTRAKRQLHLIGIAKLDDEQQPKAESGSFLALLWPGIKQHYLDAELPWQNDERDEADDTLATVHMQLDGDYQLPSAFIQEINNRQVLTDNPTQAEHYAWLPPSDRITGTVLHRMFYELCLSRINHPMWAESDWISQRANSLCQYYGMPDAEVNHRVHFIVKVFTRCLSTEIGQWLFAEHQDAHNEFAISGLYDGKLMTGIIDRTFVDQNNERWLIDYKVIQELPTDESAFVTEQSALYGKQLQLYARLLQQISKPVDHIALYFPVQNILHQLDVKANYVKQQEKNTDDRAFIPSTF